MKNWLLISLVSIFISNSKSNFETAPPLHFAMNIDWEQIQRKDSVLNFSASDTLLNHTIILLSDSTNHPILFFSEIKTPVCIDGLCKPVQINIYWNLLGNYVGFGLLNEEPLTKYDHEYFEEEDYLKLHELLLNEKSILRQKKMSDLYNKRAKADKRIKYKGIEIDGMTGATKKEIVESIVEGALYSCYTLWHLVNGAAKDEMKKYFQTIYSKTLKKEMFYSEYADYQSFALKSFTENDFETYITQVLSIFENAQPLLRTYILKKIPQQFWQKEQYCQFVFQTFSKIDIQSKTILLQKLPTAHPIVVEILSNHLTQMSKNQLKTYLFFLSENEEFVQGDILKNLKTTAGNQEFSHSYLISNFLKDRD